MSMQPQHAGPVTRFSARLREGHVFVVGPEDRSYLIDADSKIAPGPVETLLAAIITCSGVDVIDILAKRRTPVTGFAASITAHRRAEHPRRLMRIEIEYRIDGQGIDGVQAERAIELAFEKYCTVAGSLAPDIEAETQLVLNGEARPPQPRKIWTQTTTG
jgi:putative redox protein